jgi:methylated-DNA-protein-cysteine methyltransferase-like protein
MSDILHDVPRATAPMPLNQERGKAAGRWHFYNYRMANPGSHPKHALIYEATKLVPWGRVATYGQIADLAGLSGHARLAGYALYNLPPALTASVPWHRVVNARGQISYSEARLGSDVLQRELLEAEGVEFDAAGRISLRRFGWRLVAED